MVEVDCLAALDGLIWLRTGQQVASRFSFNQSTVSRLSRKCANTFNVSLVRREAEWHVHGDTQLLNLERRVHQVVRWREQRPLRLDAQHWSGPQLCVPPPAGWVTGNLNFLETHRPLQLLRDRVIDAWIASYPDVPGPEDPDLVTIRLNAMPLALVAQSDHPLFALGERLSFQDVAPYPLLPLPEGAFPAFEAALQSCGLGRKAGGAGQRPAPSWQGRQDIEALMVGFATPLTLHHYGDGYRPLPLTLPMEVGDALVVSKDVLSYPQLWRLVDELLARLRALAQGLQHVRVFEVPELNGAERPRAAEGRLDALAF